jgi:cell division septum initiation protein DivIVA
MERDGDLGNYLKFNFENAIAIIDRLTEENHELLDRIEELEAKLNKPITIKKQPISDRFYEASEEANAAMKRFTDKLRKGLNNAKSKQSQGQSV